MAESAGLTTAPPLVKLLRQISSDAKAGVISAEQRSALKESLLRDAVSARLATPATVAAYDEKKSSASSSALPTAPSADDKDNAPPPLVPLMRQLSSCHRDGLISNDMKAQLKSLLLSGLKERVQHAKSILDNQFKPKFVSLMLTAEGKFATVESMFKLGNSTTSTDMLVEIFRYCNAPTLVACSGVSSLWHTIAATHPKIKSTWQFWCTELSLRLRMPDKITQLYTTRDWSVLCGLLNHYTRARQLEAARSTTNHGAKFVAPMAYVELTLSPHTNKMIHPPQTPQGQTPCCTLRTISFADPMRAERFVAVIVEPPYSGVQTTERKRIPFRVYRAQRNKSKGRLVTASLISRFPSKARKLRVLEEKSVVTALPISVEVHRFAYPDSPPDLVQHLQISPAPLQGSYQPLAFTTSCFRQPPAVLFDFRTRIAVTRTTENVIAVFPLRPWSAGLPTNKPFYTFKLNPNKVVAHFQLVTVLAPIKSPLSAPSPAASSADITADSKANPAEQKSVQESIYQSRSDAVNTSMSASDRKLQSPPQSQSRGSAILPTPSELALRLCIGFSSGEVLIFDPEFGTIAQCLFGSLATLFQMRAQANNEEKADRDESDGDAKESQSAAVDDDEGDADVDEEGADEEDDGQDAGDDETEEVEVDVPGTTCDASWDERSHRSPHFVYTFHFGSDTCAPPSSSDPKLSGKGRPAHVPTVVICYSDDGASGVPASTPVAKLGCRVRTPRRAYDVLMRLSMGISLNPQRADSKVEFIDLLTGKVSKLFPLGPEAVTEAFMYQPTRAVAPELKGAAAVAINPPPAPSFHSGSCARDVAAALVRAQLQAALAPPALTKFVPGVLVTVHVNGSVSAFNYVKGKSTLLAPATSSNTAVGTRPTRIVLNGECGFVIVHCEDTPQTLTVWDLNTCTRLLTFAIKLQPELAKSSMDNGSIGCDLYRLWSRIPGHWSDDASDGGVGIFTWSGLKAAEGGEMGPAQPMYVFEGAPRSKFGRIASMSAHAAMLTAVYSDAYISTNHDIIRVFKAQSRVGSRLAGSGLPGSTTAALSFSPSTINSFAEGAVIHRIDGKSNACDPSRLVRVENPYGLVYNRARDRQEWLHADELNNRKKWVLSVKQTKWKLGSPAQYAHGRGKPSIVTISDTFGAFVAFTNNNRTEWVLSTHPALRK